MIHQQKIFKWVIDMRILFDGEGEDISMILVSAERYALGRRTYIVQWTCEIIKKNMHLLSGKDKAVMIRDIETAIYYGDECDKQCWINLLATLRKEIKNVRVTNKNTNKDS